MMMVHPLSNVGTMNLMLCQQGKLNGMMPSMGPNGVCLMDPSVRVSCQVCFAAACVNHFMAFIHLFISAMDCVMGFLISDVIIAANVYFWASTLSAQAFNALHRSEMGVCRHLRKLV